MVEATLDRAMGKKKQGKAPDLRPKQVSILLLKGSPEYREWLSRFGDFSRMPTAVLVDRALTKLAKEEGFEPPPRR
jgi:hypothetical protein